MLRRTFLSGYNFLLCASRTCRRSTSIARAYFQSVSLRFYCDQKNVPDFTANFVLDSTVDRSQYQRAYKAAGIVPYSKYQHSSGQLKTLILLGKETYTPLWSGFGGKIDAMDAGMEETAVREFIEETFGQFSQHHHEWVCKLKDPQRSGPLVWVGRGKFMLFFLDVPFLSTAQLIAARQDGMAAHQKEKECLAWVELQALCEALATHANSNSPSTANASHIARSITVPVHEATCAGAATSQSSITAVTLHRFLVMCLQTQGMRSALRQLDRIAP